MKKIAIALLSLGIIPLVLWLYNTVKEKIEDSINAHDCVVESKGYNKGFHDGWEAGIAFRGRHSDKVWNSLYGTERA